MSATQKTIQEVKRMLQDEGDITIKFSDNQILFSFENCFILSRLIEGEYPNYKNVIPEKTKNEVIVSRETFLSATRRASIFTDQDSIAIKLNINILEIKDTGIGIENTKKVFDRFYKEQDRGLGIGLHIVKKLCDELKIDIKINSKQDIGTIVYLDISNIIL